MFDLKKMIARTVKSFGYCRDSFLSMWKNEESFRMELVVLAIIILILALVRWPMWKKSALVACYLLIPLMEIINTAIENICDLITRDRQPLVKCAKDHGALAVLFAIMINAIVLFTLIIM